MIFDLNKTPLPEPQDYDVCIAGGGVAGITLAKTLAARGRRIALLEGGCFDFSDESQRVYEGPILGRSYFDLDSARLRFLGGSSNHWGGWCRPLDAHDFEKRRHIPHSGWPFAKAEIDPYLEAASRILEIEPDFADRDVPDSNNAFTKINFHFSTPVLFRDKYEKVLRESNRIDVFLNSNLVNIRLNESTSGVTGFECANYADPANRHSFRGKIFVLALGGIENPRVLLNCRDQNPEGIGNGRDLVGRFFMEHFHVQAGYIVLNKKRWPLPEQILYLSPTTALMDSHGLANAGLRVLSAELAGGLKTSVKHLLCAEDMIRDFVQSIRPFGCLGGLPPFDSAGYLRIVGEQVPNWDSRVLLVEGTDRFGLRRAALDWRATDIDRRTIKFMTTAFGRYLASREYGGVKLAEWLLDDASPIPGVGGKAWEGAGGHHMGTTRMASIPKEGVVDPNCRMFDITNLYIAGSSVFPTGGHANPTLTVVQLTLRLSDHVDRILEKGEKGTLL